MHRSLLTTTSVPWSQGLQRQVQLHSSYDSYITDACNVEHSDTDRAGAGVVNHDRTAVPEHGVLDLLPSGDFVQFAHVYFDVWFHAAKPDEQILVMPKQNGQCPALQRHFTFVTCLHSGKHYLGSDIHNAFLSLYVHCYLKKTSCLHCTQCKLTPDQ